MRTLRQDGAEGATSQQLGEGLCLAEEAHRLASRPPHIHRNDMPEVGRDENDFTSGGDHHIQIGFFFSDTLSPGRCSPCTRLPPIQKTGDRALCTEKRRDSALAPGFGGLPACLQAETAVPRPQARTAASGMPACLPACLPYLRPRQTAECRPRLTNHLPNPNPNPNPNPSPNPNPNPNPNPVIKK